MKLASIIPGKKTEKPGWSQDVGLILPEGGEITEWVWQQVGVPQITMGHKLPEELLPVAVKCSLFRKQVRSV